LLLKDSDQRIRKDADPGLTEVDDAREREAGLEIL
jgi:hypothetical protein